jgi:hypothetical protein
MTIRQEQDDTEHVPESGELWVEYELPRQQVVPAVTGYRYVKAKDHIQPGRN